MDQKSTGWVILRVFAIACAAISAVGIGCYTIYSSVFGTVGLTPILKVLFYNGRPEGLIFWTYANPFTIFAIFFGSLADWMRKRKKIEGGQTLPIVAVSIGIMIFVCSVALVAAFHLHWPVRLLFLSSLSYLVIIVIVGFLAQRKA